MPTNVTTTHPDLLADYVSKKQIAATLEISERTVERWVRLRQFPPPIKLGRKRLYHLPAIRKHLASLAQDQPRSRRSG